MPDELKKMVTERSQAYALSNTRRKLVGGYSLIQILLFVLVLLSIYLVFGAVREAKAIAQSVRVEQEAAKQRGYQSRATICSLQRDLGIELPEVCRQKEVLAYYDPGKPVSSSAARTAIRNLQLLCAVAKKDGLSGEVLQEYCGTG